MYDSFPYRLDFCEYRSLTKEKLQSNLSNVQPVVPHCLCVYFDKFRRLGEEKKVAARAKRREIIDGKNADLNEVPPPSYKPRYTIRAD